MSLAYASHTFDSEWCLSLTLNVYSCQMYVYSVPLSSVCQCTHSFRIAIIHMGGTFSQLLGYRWCFQPVAASLYVHGMQNVLLLAIGICGLLAFCGEGIYSAWESAKKCIIQHHHSLDQVWHNHAVCMLFACGSQWAVMRSIIVLACEVHV